MKNEFVIEFWFEGEVIDWKKSNLTPIIPRVGERVSIVTWENQENSRGNNYWIVQEIRHGIGKNKDETLLTQLVMIDIIPDPNKGRFKSEES